MRLQGNLARALPQAACCMTESYGRPSAAANLPALGRDTPERGRRP